MIDGLGRNAFAFTITTKITDARFNGLNVNNITYRNDVEFLGDVKVNDVRREDYKDTANRSITPISTVLAKTSTGSYNYTDNTMQWQIVVNQNGMEMTGAKLLETVSQYQTITGITWTRTGSAPTSGTINPSAITDVTSGNTGLLTGNFAGGTVYEIDLGGLANGRQLTLTVTTKMDVDENPDFRDGGKTSTTAHNKASLTHDGTTGTINSTEVSRTISISQITKSAGKIYIAGSGNTVVEKIRYSIMVNPNGLDLSNFKDLTLEDTLPGNLRLIYSSVEFYAATLSPPPT